LAENPKATAKRLRPAGLAGHLQLYATIVPLLAYAVFGPSRIITTCGEKLFRAQTLNYR